MNESELIEIMYEKNFSKKQIDNLKKLSKRYSTSLYVTVHELADRFFRSLLVHIFSFLMVFHSYIYHSKNQGHTFGGVLLAAGTLGVAYVIFDFFAPLLQAYKARKVINVIKNKKIQK
ncbi:hypothetical protein [Enterobacter soli]|uniref:hypothetical protein n=1 Tax=Enterobacter soli TaxID=885040 RepID=UPI0034CD768A